MSTGIPQVGSIGTRKVAPPPIFGQSKRVSGGGSQVQGATDPSRPELADLFREAASLSGNTATNGAEFVRRWTEFLSSLPEDH